MLVYRATSELYAKDLSGTGAKLAGGRWNSRGIPALYASESRALCQLEVLVHINLKQMPDDLVLLSLHVPDYLPVRTITLRELSSGWDAFPPDPFTRELGDELLRDPDCCVFRVPSSVVPEEYNYVLNPASKAFHEIEIADERELGLDRFFFPKPK